MLNNMAQLAQGTSFAFLQTLYGPFCCIVMKSMLIFYDMYVFILILLSVQ